MKKTILIALACLLSCSAGCGPPIGYGDPGTRAVRGAALGAAVGALATGRGKKGLTRNAWAGAAIGGLVGAATAPPRQPYYPQPAPSAYYGYGY